MDPETAKTLATSAHMRIAAERETVKAKKQCQALEETQATLRLEIKTLKKDAGTSSGDAKQELEQLRDRISTLEDVNETLTQRLNISAENLKVQEKIHGDLLRSLQDLTTSFIGNADKSNKKNVSRAEEEEEDDLRKKKKKKWNI